MGNAREWELIGELSQGKELAEQLRNSLQPSSSQETREFLVKKLLSSYDKALTMLKCGAFVGESQTNFGMLESPRSLSGGSPRSEGSDRDFKNQYHKNAFKKRKTLSRRREQVRVCLGTEQEGPRDDGYSWRKYGQKDILGAKFPRGYYRCTHRHVQGCLATKQVQRSDGDPSILEITYLGRHTCTQASQVAVPLASPGKKVPKQNNSIHQQRQQEQLLSHGTELEFNFEELETREQIFSSFPFPSAPLGLENVEDYVFSQSMSENNLMGSFSPAFVSPATSESNYFSLSPCEMNSFGMGQILQTSDSDPAEIISAPTSVTNSPIGDLDFSLDPVELDPNFPFDTLDFLS